MFCLFFLFLPVAALFVVLADTEGASEFLALFDLCLGQLVDLMRFEASGVGGRAFGGLFGLKLLAQSGTLVLDFVFVDSGCC